MKLNIQNSQYLTFDVYSMPEVEPDNFNEFIQNHFFNRSFKTIFDNLKLEDCYP